MTARPAASLLVCLACGCTNVAQVLRERGDDALLAGAYVQAYVNYDEAARLAPSEPPPAGLADTAPHIAALKLAEAEEAEFAGRIDEAWDRLEWLRTRSWLPPAPRAELEARRARLYGVLAARLVSETQARIESAPEQVFREAHALARVEVPLLAPTDASARALFDLRQATGRVAWTSIAEELRALRFEQALANAAELSLLLSDAGQSPAPSLAELQLEIRRGHERLANDAGADRPAARLFHLLSLRRAGGNLQESEINRLFRDARIGYRALGAGGLFASDAGLLATFLSTDPREVPRAYELVVELREDSESVDFSTADDAYDCRDVAVQGSRTTRRECRHRSLAVQATVTLTLRGRAFEKSGLVSADIDGRWTGTATRSFDEARRQRPDDLAGRAHENALRQAADALRQRLDDDVARTFEALGRKARAAGRTLDAEDAFAQLVLLGRPGPATPFFLEAYGIPADRLETRLDPRAAPLALPAAPAPQTRWTSADPGELPAPQDSVPLWSDPRRPHLALRVGGGSQVGIVGVSLEYRPFAHLGFSVGTGLQALSVGGTLTTARHLGEGGFYADLQLRAGRQWLEDGVERGGLSAGGTIGYDFRSGWGSLKLGAGGAGNLVPDLAPYLSPLLDLAVGVVF
jgi:hypothetical protein